MEILFWAILYSVMVLITSVIVALCMEADDLFEYVVAGLLSLGWPVVLPILLVGLFTNKVVNLIHRKGKDKTHWA